MVELPCHIGVRYNGEPDDTVRQVAFEPGVPLREILNSSSVQVRSACSGIGACGLCRVRIDTGSVGPLTATELLHLDDEAIADGVRLACQVVPTTDLDVSVLVQARPSSWRTPLLASYQPAYPHVAPPALCNGARLGVAVDLGTSHISLAVCDLASGRRIAVRTGPNPQASLCADIIGRLDLAAQSPHERARMQALAEGAIRDGLTELSRGEGLPLKNVARLRVAGNTAMLTLLCGADPEPLLDPKQWSQFVESTAFDHPGLAEVLGLPATADAALVPAQGGFVGSDLTLGIVHCRLHERSAPAALIDFGTNSEVGLWDGHQLWVTAAAGGPAFEGVGVSCGMAAEPGAIYQLSRSAAGEWRGEVLEGAPVAGICGSGMIDLVALLRACGSLDERGRSPDYPLAIPLGGRDFSVSKSDIDMLQRAKGAIAAGLETLCRRAGLEVGEIADIYVAGAFGAHLDLANAMQVGLLPSLPVERFHLAGNTALCGALDILLSPEAEAALSVVRANTRLINLSMDKDFDELFVHHLFLHCFAGLPSR
jgi:uncharacterized 2Fe-2S/4Fe-4S cluster protein (DUF4445 family)